MLFTKEFSFSVFFVHLKACVKINAFCELFADVARVRRGAGLRDGVRRLHHEGPGVDALLRRRSTRASRRLLGARAARRVHQFALRHFPGAAERRRPNHVQLLPVRRRSQRAPRISARRPGNKKAPMQIT